VQYVDGAELILGDPVRTTKVVSDSVLGRIILRGVTIVPKDIVDFFLGKDTFHLSIYRAMGEGALLAGGGNPCRGC
jgi:hypothetical protein